MAPTCPRCGSSDPAMTRTGTIHVEATGEHMSILVSGHGLPTCIDGFHDGARPWVDETWLAERRALAALEDKDAD